MNVDLLASIEMTACAAVAIAVLAIGFGEDVSTRIRLATGLAAWFMLVTAMAATEVLHDQRGFGVPGLGVAVILPLVILSVGVFRSPTLYQALRAIPLSALIVVNVIRVFGVMFLLLYAAGRLPAPFAPVAGWGDILVGLFAAPVAWLAHKKGATAASRVRIWNTIGLLDLIAAVGLGVASSSGPLQPIFTEPGSGIMTTLPWLLIPGFLVPLLASTHLAVFYRLSTAGERRNHRTHERPATV
ncbi:MAG TPA: hypothetical protein VFN94_11825 [Nitrospiria bacterium]|nr:hypothetical protein [Nitrospiria bacterium]